MGQRVALNSYISNYPDDAFQWGVNDCFTFTNGAFHAMYGAGYADDWIGRYMNKNSPKSRKSMLKEFSHTTLFDGLASKLRRTDQPIFGSLVTTSKCKHWVTGCSLGISLGSRAVFLSESGLLKVNVEDVESSWVLK